MIALLSNIGSFVENDAYVPKPGDILFYDWDDSGLGDNKNGPDHVGIVEKVSGNTITVIEGNYSQSVKRRNIAVNGKYIRGYGVPKYDEEQKEEEKTTTTTKVDYKMEMRNLKKGCKGEDVRALQILLKGHDCNGNMSTPDGIFGPNTLGAVKLFQKKAGLPVTGIADQPTMCSLLGVKTT
jgi:hypothetical protein